MEKGSSSPTEDGTAPQDGASSQGGSVAEGRLRWEKGKTMPVYKVQRRSDREKKEALRLQARLRLAALLLSVVLLAVSAALLVRANQRRSAMENEQYHRPAAARVQAAPK